MSWAASEARAVSEASRRKDEEECGGRRAKRVAGRMGGVVVLLFRFICLTLSSFHLTLSFRSFSLLFAPPTHPPPLTPIDNLADLVDKHLFGKGGKVSKTGHSNTIDSATTMALMADVGRIRSELAFKCDGAFVKSTLEGKANKQSVADALHNKANKKTVAKEMAEIRSLVKKQVGDLKGHIEDLYKNGGGGGDYL